MYMNKNMNKNKNNELFAVTGNMVEKAAMLGRKKM